MRQALALVCVLATSLPSLAADAPRKGGNAARPTAAAAAMGAGLSNTLRWSTASELNNVGFDVYRSNEEKGPFVRLTAKPIPGAGTTDETTQYVWVDETIEPEKTYWYYVESISMSGVREKFTPTFKAPVKHIPSAKKAPAATPPPPR